MPIHLLNQRLSGVLRSIFLFWMGIVVFAPLPAGIPHFSRLISPHPFLPHAQAETTSVTSFIEKQTGPSLQLSGAPLSSPTSVESGQRYWIISFISSRCPCSQAHQARLFELHQEFGTDPRFRFIGINANQDEKEAEAKAYFDSQQFPFPIFRDTRLEWLDHFPALKTPHVFIYSVKEGKIVYQGGIDDSSHPVTSKVFHLKEALEDLKLGKMPRTAKTRALGCQIRRSSS